MTSTFADRLSGHVRTVLPAALGWLPRTAGRHARQLSIPVTDERFGATALGATLHDPDGSTRVVVLVHGLGGNRSAGYVRHAARRLRRHGFATLALDLRGADRRGGGFYHVAQHEDLLAACRAPELRGYAEVFVLGFSMGGHVAVHFAASGEEPRLRGTAALCTPLDLGAMQRHIDGHVHVAYRRYVLRGLKRIYAAVARRHDDVPTANAAVQRCRTFHEWDRLTIAPRYGFASPEAFYEANSAAACLPRLRSDVVLVLARNDPIVPPQLTTAAIANAPAGRLHVRVLRRGGHLQFGGGQRLGLPEAGDGSITDQLARHWLWRSAQTVDGFRTSTRGRVRAR